MDVTQRYALIAAYMNNQTDEQWGKLVDTVCADRGIPNLDSLNVNELDGVRETLLDVARYVGCYSGAIRYRGAGNINEALRLEKYMDEIYDELPVWAKW